MSNFNWSAPADYNAANKIRFHNAARKQLKALAIALRLAPASFEIRSNKAGVAVSGEITLHSESVYVQVSQSCIGVGMGVLIRSCNGRKDYSGGRNHWLPLSALNDPRVLAHYVRRVHLDSVWEKTHPDYRSDNGHCRYILEYDPAHGTCSVPLESSRAAQIR